MDEMCVVFNGFVIIIVLGGIGGFIYSDDGGVIFQVLVIFNGLVVNMYNMVVIDVNICMVFGIVVINNQVFLVIIGVIVMDVQCNVVCDGIFLVMVLGGIGMIFYFIGIFQVLLNFIGICVGFYMLMVIDVNGCIDIQLFIVIELMVFMVIVILIDLMCFNDNIGEILFFVSGGIMFYLYSIDNGVIYNFGILV